MVYLQTGAPTLSFCSLRLNWQNLMNFVSLSIPIPCSCRSSAFLNISDTTFSVLHICLHHTSPPSVPCLVQTFQSWYRTADLFPRSLWLKSCQRQYFDSATFARGIPIAMNQCLPVGRQKKNHWNIVGKLVFYSLDLFFNLLWVADPVFR